MKLDRIYTKNLSSPYEGLDFVERLSKDFSNSSNVVNFIAPKNWSQVAVDIIAQKYRSKKANELDARDIFERLSSTWAYFAQKSGLLCDESALIFKEECQYMLAHQIAAPNSPQWFNTGLHHYSKSSSFEGGHFFFDEEEKKVKELANSFERPQAHACFIQGVKDVLVGTGSIMDLWEREARLFKYGSGSGTNFSALRGSGEMLSGGGRSSGLMSWLKIGDAAAGAVKSGGTTRRAAKMVCLDADHPDVEEFISWKYKEEQKVSFLVIGQRIIRTLYFMMLENQSREEIEDFQEKHNIDEVIMSRLRLMLAQGIDLKTFDEGESLNFDWEGEAYQSISGQNANNSIRLNHDFFEKLKSNSDWELINRTDKEVNKTLKTADLFNKIAVTAWSCADPGLQFNDTINEWHTCPEGGPIIASNPCSEYMFLDDTACNLASINLVKFLKDGHFDSELFKKVVNLWTIVLETTVSMASYPSKEIALKSYQYRTLGLGYANLGGLLMRMGLGYDSAESRALASAISSLMTAEAYRTSTVMAEVLEPFSFYQDNKEHCKRVLSNHFEANNLKPKLSGVKAKAVGIENSFSTSQEIICVAQESWKEVLKRLKKFGLRNAQVSAIAPTGTIALLMDCDTTGIEPDFSLVKYKGMAGGGVVKIVNQSVGVALKLLGYDDNEREAIIEFILKENGVVGAPNLKEEYYSLFDCAQSPQVSSQSLDLSAHLLMMAAVQPFISGGISKTINLASDSSIEDVKNAFIRSYELGLKSVALYRDQSKLSQPLRGSESSPGIRYSHLSCLNCGERMLLPSGTCMRCENCGESTSCS